jgi:hypothetical protein
LHSLNWQTYCSFVPPHSVLFEQLWFPSPFTRAH